MLLTIVNLLTCNKGFKDFIDNPLKDVIQLRVLKSNANIIKLLDETIKSLIKSRYPSIDEYKQKIKQGQNLPTYIRSLLTENNYFKESEDDNKTSEVVSATTGNTKNLSLKLLNENVQTRKQVESANTPLYSPFSIETKIDPNQNVMATEVQSEEQNEINQMLLVNVDLNREVFVDNASELVQPPSVFFRKLIQI